MSLENHPETFGPQMGKTLIILGVFLIVVGLIFLFRERLPPLKSLGKLPGDIAIEKENFKFYFPLTTSLLVSAILSLILWFFRR
ncbi:MAG: DUF2905 domain-containing protein [Bdellovibrionales bacterium]|nr:DUF2905 domain-containing protein [Bdellovibrionales bacterium]